MKKLCVVLLFLAVAYDCSATTPGVLMERFSSRPVVLSSCNAGRVNVYLALVLDDGASSPSGGHSLLVLDPAGNGIVAWQEFNLASDELEILESSGGIALTDLLSGWRDFLLKQPLSLSCGVEWLDLPVHEKCPASSDNPWTESGVN